MAEISMPGWMPETLRGEFERLAPILRSMGTLRSVDADALGRLCLLRYELTAAFQQASRAMGSGDLETAQAWMSMQDKLTKQVGALEDRFGLSPDSREQRGLILPRDS